MLSRGDLHDEPLVRTLGTDRLMNFLGRHHYIHVVKTTLLMELSTSLVSSRRRDSCKLAPGFLWTLIDTPFPLLIFALYSFAVVKLTVSIIIC